MQVRGRKRIVAVAVAFAKSPFRESMSLNIKRLRSYTQNIVQMQSLSQLEEDGVTAGMQAGRHDRREPFDFRAG